MRFDDVITHYGTQAAVARALNINPAAVAQWAAAGKVPLLRQHQIERITGGALQADDPVIRQGSAATRTSRSGMGRLLHRAGLHYPRASGEPTGGNRKA